MLLPSYAVIRLYVFVFQVEGIDFSKSARTHEFPHEGRSITMVEYFRNRYRKELQFPDAPLIQCAPKSKGTFLPPELVEVSMQKYPGPTTESLKNALAGLSAMCARVCVCA